MTYGSARALAGCLLIAFAAAPSPSMADEITKILKEMKLIHPEHEEMWETAQEMLEEAFLTAVLAAL